MTATTMTSREFNHDTGRAKKAAKNGPVFITDRGKPAHVLLTVEEFERLRGNRTEPEHATTSKKKSLLEALAQSGEDADFDFEFPRMRDGWLKPADLD